MSDEKFYQDLFDKRVEEYQRDNFGTSRLKAERYVGASMSKMQWDQEDMQKVLSYMNKKKNFLVVLGGVGRGKTYLCSALTEWIMKNFKSYRYWPESKLLDRIKQGFDTHEGSPKVLEYLIDDEHIILDDVGSVSWTEWKEDKFFDFLDMRYNSMLPTIITSNLTRDDFNSTYKARIPSRLFAKENTIIELKNDVDLRQLGM